jgi:hypothetical protein
MKSSILLAFVALMSTGCFSAHAHYTPPIVYAPPPPVQPAVVVTPSSVAIQWHYVYVNATWIRRAGPPPRGSVYHAHPSHRRTVIVHRSSSGHRAPVYRSTNRRPSQRTVVRPSNSHRRSSVRTNQSRSSSRNSASRGTNQSNNKNGRSTRRR